MTNATRHARVRAQQRCVNEAQIDLVLRYGAAIKQPGGRLVYHCGRREVARARRDGVSLSGLEGIAVVLAGDGAILTIIRSPDRRRLKQFQHYQR